jgi:hypothetical protein
MDTIQMTPAQFAAKIKTLQADGVNLVDTTADGVERGTAQKSGVTISYSYNFALGTLGYEVVNKPRLLPLAMAKSRLKSWLTN